MIVEWALALPLTTAFARLYIGPCESQALIQQRDNGIPIMVFRLLPHGVEWARGKALRLLEFYARAESIRGAVDFAPLQNVFHANARDFATDGRKEKIRSGEDRYSDTRTFRFAEKRLAKGP